MTKSIFIRIYIVDRSYVSKYCQLESHEAVGTETIIRLYLWHIYLSTLSTHLITLIWRRNYSKGPFHHYIGYSLRLAARDLLFDPSHRQVNTYPGLCCTSVETRNSSMGTQWRIDLTTHRTMSKLSTTDLHLAQLDL